MTKPAIRQLILDRRRSVSAADYAEWGSLVQDAFMALGEYVSADLIALYHAVRGEVPTDRVMAHALAAGKKVCLPAVEKEGLVFRQISGNSDLVPGRFGIHEPHSGCRPVNPEDIDLIVVPGVGFDLCGQRIGYGRGYYDRALHRLESSGRLIAFCFEFQLLDSIRADHHDVIMDRIITEQRVVTPALIKIKGELI
jgi:5-formyltetrahydrofolate cyclo-ligase